MRAGNGHGDLVLGADIGGTSTRILVVDHRGEPCGRGMAAGGNPTTHPDSAGAALAEALGKALAAVDPAAIRAAVVGLAGGGALRAAEVWERLTRIWVQAGVSVEPRYVSDLEVAFASGTAATDGTVLIAGTGAAAGAVRAHRIVRTAGGHGWLLGDEGSGFWLGREAVRSTLRALDSGQPLGPLATSVVQALAAHASTAAAERAEPSRLRSWLVQEVNSRPPIQLAALAPLVSDAYGDDPAAADIVERAAHLLVATLEQIREPQETSPLVLAGSVTSASSPVGARLRDGLALRFSGPVLAARNGVGGAAWLALAAAAPAAATASIRERLVAE
ncbi:MAG: N-acetylglucosamine kinase [Nocardioidaceae bacterium]